MWKQIEFCFKYVKPDNFEGPVYSYEGKNFRWVDWALASHRATLALINTLLERPCLAVRVWRITAFLALLIPLAGCSQSGTPDSNSTIPTSGASLTDPAKLVPPQWQPGMAWSYRSDLQERMAETPCPDECPTTPNYEQNWMVEAIEDKNGFQAYRIGIHGATVDGPSYGTVWLDVDTLGIVAGKLGDVEYQIAPPLQQIFPMETRDYQSSMSSPTITLQAGLEVRNRTTVRGWNDRFDAIELRVWIMQAHVKDDPRDERTLWYAPEPGILVQFTGSPFDASSREVFTLYSSPTGHVPESECTWGWKGRAIDPSVHDHIVARGPVDGYRVMIEPAGNGSMPGHTAEEQPRYVSAQRNTTMQPGNYSVSLSAYGHAQGPADFVVQFNNDSPKTSPGDERLNEWRRQVYQELGLPEPAPVEFITQRTC